MNLFEFLYLLVFVSSIKSEEVRSLCEDPVIHAADRLPNNTYRVYRDNHYWELIGLPDPIARVKGPFPIWYQYMAPIDKASSVQTVVTGNSNGITLKYRAKKFWMYNQAGALIQGGKTGFDWKDFPPSGFSAVLNDGGMGGNNFPVMIGFSGITAYYYNTNGRDFRPIGKSDGYIGGKDGEKFPGDLTAAFAYPSNKPEVKYYVYLFKRREYCFRPIIGEDDCKEWRQNTDLFGCSDSAKSNTTKNPDSSQTESPQTGKTSEEKPPNTNEPVLESNSQESNSESSSGLGLILIVIIVVVLVVVAIVIGVVVFGMRGKPSEGANKSGAPPPKSQAGAKPGKPVASKA